MSEYTVGDRVKAVGMPGTLTELDITDEIEVATVELDMGGSVVVGLTSLEHEEP